MIQFPLKIEVFQNQDGMWRAYSPGFDFERSCMRETREQTLGAVFFILKDIPGFHLWTFNIVSQGLNDVRIVPPKQPMVSNPIPSVYEMEVFKESGKIAAIKAYRERTGLGLKECKDAIEEDAARLGLEPRR
jgi:hypothetical protein